MTMVKMLSVSDFHDQLTTAAKDEPVVGRATELSTRFGISRWYLNRYLAAIADALGEEGFLVGKTSASVFVIAETKAGGRITKPDSRSATSFSTSRVTPKGTQTSRPAIR